MLREVLTEVTSYHYKVKKKLNNDKPSQKNNFTEVKSKNLNS